MKYQILQFFLYEENGQANVALTVLQWRNFASKNMANIGSGSGLLTAGCQILIWTNALLFGYQE